MDSHASRAGAVQKIVSNILVCNILNGVTEQHPSSYINWIIVFLSYFLIRTSVQLFVLRLLPPHKKWQARTIVFVFFLNVAISLFAMISYGLSCTPFRANWADVPNAKCLPQHILDAAQIANGGKNPLRALLKRRYTSGVDTSVFHLLTTSSSICHHRCRDCASARVPSLQSPDAPQHQDRPQFHIRDGFGNRSFKHRASCHVEPRCCSRRHDLSVSSLTPVCCC